MNIFANFLNDDNFLERRNSANSVFNHPQQKSVVSKSAFTKIDPKDIIKATSKMELNLINNSDSHSTLNSINTTSRNDNVSVNNHLLVNNFNYFNKSGNPINKFGNINLNNQPTFTTNNNIFPNQTTNNNINENSQLFANTENSNNFNHNNFINKNCFQDKHYNFQGIFNKDKNLDKQKHSQTNKDLLNKKTKRENFVIRKETVDSLIDSNFITYSNVKYSKFQLNIN